MSDKQKGQGMLYVKPGSKKGLVFPSFFNFVIFWHSLSIVLIT